MDGFMIGYRRNLIGEVIFIWATLRNPFNPFVEWFVGLTDHFLNAPCLKLLVLAATNRLVDKKLLIGQMQGKFQVKILNNTQENHAIHEDHPKELAEILFQYWTHFSKPIPKFGNSSLKPL